MTKTKNFCVIYRGINGVSEALFHSLGDAIKFAIFWPENTYNLVFK